MKKKKPFWKILLYILIVIVIALLVVLPFVFEAANNVEKDNASILTARAEKKDIEKNISGTGTLTDEEAVEIELPYGVEVTKYLVDNNDFVTEGTPLAEVDRIAVMNAIYEYQDDMAYVEQQMRLLTDNGASTFLTTASKGRVMEIYAEVGDSISDVMLEHGALAVISLDGLLAVDAEGLDAYPVGSTLYVASSNGSVVPGRIESRKESISVITLDQEGETSGDRVQILDGNFNPISEGTLYVHSPLNISGYSGTIEAVHVIIDQDVIAGATIFTYSGNPSTAEYGVYAARHKELEELTGRLFKMYTDGTVNAPCAGVVTGIDEDAAAELLASKSNEKPTLDFMVDTGKKLSVKTVADEEPAVYYKTGKVTQMHILEENSYLIHSLSVDKYDTIDEAEAAMETAEFDYNENNKLYFESYGLSASDLSLGTSLLFAYDAIYGNFTVSVIESGGGSGGGDSGGGTGSGGASGGMSTSMSTGSSTTQATHEYYSTKTTKPMSIVPQDVMTVDITIDELDILSIEKGQSALVTLDALAGQSFDGIITDIGVSGSNSGGNSKYTAEVTIERQPNMIAGMNATANITVSVKKDVLTLPADAIVEDGTRSYVYTGYDEKEETLIAPIDITTGQSDGINVEILSGISEGQEVWYKYYDKTSVSFDFPAPPDFG